MRKIYGMALVLFFFVAIASAQQLQSKNKAVGQTSTTEKMDKAKELQNEMEAIELQNAVQNKAAEKVGQNVFISRIKQSNIAAFINNYAARSKSGPLYEQHELVSDPGAGSGGADASELEATQSTWGHGMQQTAGNSVADDFIVPAGQNWAVDGFKFYGYQTGSTTTSTMTGVYARIYNGDPQSGGTIIHDWWATNIMTATSWTNCYRVENGDLTNTQRPIMVMECTVPQITLGPGTYWIEWCATGSLASGPWVPHLQLVSGVTTTGNAIQYQTSVTAWVVLEDPAGELQGMPFDVLGTSTDPAAPAAPKNFVVTPGAMGAVNATVAWNNPDSAYNGAVLTDLDSVVLFVNGVAEYVNTTPTIGGAESQLYTGTASGYYTFLVQGFNDAGAGASVSEEVWIGLDAPSAVTGLTLTNPSGNVAHLEWTNPVTGLHGGYFDSVITGYTITRLPDNQVFNVSGSMTSWDDNTITNVATYSYTVVPINTIGNGSSATSNSMVIGLTSATVPFMETFNSGGSPYFLFSTAAQSNVAVTSGVGVGSTHAIKAVGGASAGWTQTGTTTAAQAWSYTDHITSSTANIDATSLTAGATLTLNFDMRQYSYYNVTYSWFRLKVNGTPVADISGNIDIKPATLSSDPFTTHIYDLSAYSGTVFSIEFQTACKYVGSYEDGVLIDNINVFTPSPFDLKAIELTGNLMPTQNTAATYQFEVMNNGGDTADNYTVELFEVGNATPIATQAFTDPIAPLAYATLDIDWTPTVVGLTDIYAVINLVGDTNNYNDTTAAIQLDVQPEGVVVVNIGDSTGMVNTIPFDFYYQNSMAQTIYFPDEIGIGGGVISKVIYHNNFVTDTLDHQPIKIWIGETTQTNFTGGASKWIDADSLTLVYDSTAAFPEGQNNIVINLTTPYIYQGGNLVICTNRPMDSHYYSSNNKFYVSANAAHANRTIELHSDGTTLDPTAAPPAGVTANVLNIHPNTGILLNTAGLGHIEGTVTDNVSSDSIAGASVKIMGSPATYTTNANGHYAIMYQLPDTVDLLTSNFGYYNDTTEVIILADSTVYYDIALNPLPQVAVTGVVQTNDNMGVGLQGAVVMLEGYEDYTDTTDANGAFTLANVWGEHTYNITITYPGYATYTDTIIVGAVALDLDTITITEVLYPALGVVAVDMNDSVNINWLVPGSFNSVEYIYDDGTSENGWAINPTYTSWLGNQFPVTDQGTITSFDLYAQVNASAGAEQVIMEFFDASHVSIGTTAPFTIPADNWITVPVSDIPFNGEFYAMVKWPALTGQTNYVGFDEDGTYAASNYDWYYDGSAWSNLHTAAGSSAGVFLIRVTANVTGKGAVKYDYTNGAKSLQSYNVYRGLSGDEANVDSWIPVTNTTDTFAIDNDWDTCAPAVYKYAVRAEYTGGVQAAAAFSNALPKDMFVPFTVNLTTNSGDPVTGAVVTLNNVDNDTTYTMTATSAAVLFPAVWRGNYDITVQLAGFETIDTANIDITETGSLALQLIEIIENPFGLSVSTTGLPMGQAMMEWNVSYGFSDNFDSYSSFALSFGNWTLVDVDGAATYGFSGVTFPNSGSPMAGIIFNPDSTTPPITTSPAYSGTKYLAVFNPADASACDDWVISPKTMVPNNGQVSFWARGGNASYSAEVFQVFVSTTNTTPASFVALSPIVTCPAGSIDWVQYTYSLSTYAGQEVYVGIHVTSVDQFYFCVDDFAIGAPVDTKAFLGYDVYVDDMVTPVATGVDSTHYLLTGLALGQHVAGVKAVYTTGSSILITDTFEIVQTYSVTYNVTSDGTAPVEGATVELTGYGTQTTNASGVAVFNGVLAAATPGIAWTATKTGHVAQNGNVIVDGNEVVNVTMPFTPYNVTFTVRSTYNIPINGATIAIPGQTSQTTNASGQAVFSLINGAYTYTVSYPYDTVTGNFTVNGANLPVSVIVTGIGEMQQANNFTIYPNPAKDVLYINSENRIDNIKVVDMLGNVVFQGEVNDKAVKLITTTYQAGLYLIYMESKQQIFIKKIQIVK